MIVDSVLRELIGWPSPRWPESDREILDDLRAMLAEHREAAAQRQRERELDPWGGRRP